MYNDIRKIFCIIVILSLMLCGCKKTPDSEVIISKNDGTFDTNVLQSATENHSTSESQPPSYTDNFFSTDGSVEIQIDISDNITTSNMPVVEITPHYLTEEDARRVAQVLFENAIFYEARPTLDKKYSKAEILQKIDRWSNYANNDAIWNLYGQQRESTVDLIKRFIDEYTIMSETAPEDPVVIPCQWRFKKSSYYSVSEERAATRDISKDSNQISAEVILGDIPYKFNAVTRNLSDYKLNNLSAYIDPGNSPDSIDDDIFRAQLCRTEQPNQEQMLAIQQKTEYMLNEMKLGRWQIDQCYVKTQYYGDVAEYTVCVNAVPVINGVPVVRQPQLMNLKSKDSYASNYYLTDASFEFSVNGELISFRMYSPFDVKKTINDNVSVLGFDELVGQAKKLLMYRDSDAYGLSGMSSYVGETIKCNVSIEEMAYGLSRVKVPETDESYYYVPSVTFKGSTSYYGEDTGNLYFESEGAQSLIALNAVDGTVIELWQN